MEQAVSNYLSNLGIPISKKYCEKLIASHADYPSLLSVADTLERLGIRHRVARVEETELDRLPFPYLLHSDGQGGKLYFMRHQKDLAAMQDREDAGQVVVLQAAPTDEIADPENRRRRLEETLHRASLVVFGLALAGLLFVHLPSVRSLFWIHFSLLFLAVAGSVIGWLLIGKEFGTQYKQPVLFAGPAG
ncbi:hypothetical protein NC796_09000 [Aliifodinibius sp. S!AR15-10]|uniref:hypothetical protein n=1 Tax=Aliifodinibius sp. S!AR15-10 TaxID=2950437 RepID=UPI0028602385|nr:hypothetical protein [Aliifodinibius sp. S!AR15-10]MDR8391272.1 hypothetical protein [Aliifodinibius sp. S!AR15-10]